MDDLIQEVEPDLNGLNQLINQEFDIHSNIEDLKKKILKDGNERKNRRFEKVKKKKEGEGKTKFSKTIPVPSTLSKPRQVDELISCFQELKEELALYKEIEVSIKIQD